MEPGDFPSSNGSLVNKKNKREENKKKMWSFSNLCLHHLQNNIKVNRDVATLLLQAITYAQNISYELIIE